MSRTIKHRPSFLELNQFQDPASIDKDAEDKIKSLDAQKAQFLKKFKLLLNDQIKRKEIIDQIQKLAKKKNYTLSNKPTIANENFKFEWFVATDEPSMIDSLYYLYFWVLLKGKYLLDDINEESASRLRKKASFYQSSTSNNANSSNDSIYIDSPSKLSTIANHHSTTRFEKDILKAKKSVGDLRSQFAKIINDEHKENYNSLSPTSASAMNGNKFYGSKPSSATTSRKSSFSSYLSPTNSPVTKKFNVSSSNNNNATNNNTSNNAHNTNSTHNNPHSPTAGRNLVHKFSELPLVESPYIKNVLKFKFDMSTYLNVLIENYGLNNEVLPLEFLINSSNNLPPPKVVFRNNQVNEEIIRRLPGYEYLLLIADNPIDADCSEHLKFVHELLIQHLQAGLIWDFHSIYQTSGNLQSDIKNLYFKENEDCRLEYFKHFSKTLINLIFEFYKNKNKREDIVKQFNLNPKNHIKINDLKLNYSVLKYNETWKSWNELDFIVLNNFIFPSKSTDDKTRIMAKREEWRNLEVGQSMTFYAWNQSNNSKIEQTYMKV